MTSPLPGGALGGRAAGEAEKGAPGSRGHLHKLIVDRIAFDSGKPLMEKFLDFFCKNFTEHMVH